ncbi:hypothetical protein AT1219_80102 [Vibrio alginolyticus]
MTPNFYIKFSCQKELNHCHKSIPDNEIKRLPLNIKLDEYERSVQHVEFTLSALKARYLRKIHD